MKHRYEDMGSGILYILFLSKVGVKFSFLSFHPHQVSLLWLAKLTDEEHLM